MKLYLGISLIIVCLGLSLAAPLNNTLEVQHVEKTEELPQETKRSEIHMGTIVFKPNPGLFQEFTSGVESKIHSKEPVASQLLVAGAPKNNPQPDQPQSRHSALSVLVIRIFLEIRKSKCYI